MMKKHTGLFVNIDRLKETFIIMNMKKWKMVTGFARDLNVKTVGTLKILMIMTMKKWNKVIRFA